MKFSIDIQYLAPGSDRPEDCSQDQEIVFETCPPIPNVGDSVHYYYGGTRVDRKVVTRHFSYVGDLVAVNIVVTDIDDEEMARRLKE